jgi:YD repeat-containing protein
MCPAASYDFVEGVHLSRTDANGAAIDALAGLLGGRVGVDGVLDDLNRRARRTLAPGRAVHSALTWDAEDRRTTRWWPQGISTSADASDTEDIAGRRVLAVTWYAHELAGEAHHGSRVTFLDLDSRRYRHVLLVVPELAADGTVRLEPLKVHAGGIVWCGPYLHIAATGRGFVTCRADDLLRVPDPVASGDRTRLGVDGDRLSTYGYRYVLPVRFAYRAGAEDGHENLRYSFLSLDRGVAPPELVVGEYARGQQTRRLARFPLDPDSMLLVDGEDGLSRPLMLDDGGVLQTQGATVARGRFHLTVSHGPVTPGSVYVGRPGSFRRHRWAAPMGPEDIAYWPSTDLLWSVSEHPGRRWLFSMRRSWFDR